MIESTSPAEQIFFVTGRVQCKAAATAWSGTGFFVSIPVGDGSTKMIFVTNKYVLDGAQLFKRVEVRTESTSVPVDPPEMGSSSAAASSTDGTEE